MSRHKGNATKKNGAFNLKRNAQGNLLTERCVRPRKITQGSAGGPMGETRKQIREKRSGRGEASSTAGSRAREGAWPLPASVTAGCLQLGVGFPFEQFNHYFRLRKASLFHLWTERRDSPLHRETHELPVPHGGCSLDVTERKSSPVEDPQGKGGVTSPSPGERIHPDPANVWTRAAFKTHISMCLL